MRTEKFSHLLLTYFRLMRKSFLQVASIAFIGGLVGRGLRYFLNVIIARSLGPEALGVFAFGIVVMKASAVAARVGLNNAAQKFIPIYLMEDDDSKLLGTVILCLIIPLILGVILAIIIYVAEGYVNRITGESFTSVTQVFLLGIPMFAVMTVGMSATKGFQETKYAVLIRDLGQSGLAVLMAVIGGYVFADIRVIVLGYLGSLLFGILLVVLSLWRQGGIQWIRPEFEGRRLIMYATPLTIVAITQYFISWTDILMLGFLVPASELGWYQAAFQTSVMLTIVLNAANSIFPALTSDLHSRGQHERLRRIHDVVTKWVTYLTVLGAVFILFYAGDILTLFGASTPEARISLRILAIGQAIVAVTGPVGFLLLMTGYERLDAANTVIVAFTNVILNYFLIRQFGVVGAALATSSALALLNLLRLGEVWWSLNQNPFGRNYWKGLLAILFASTVMWFGQLLPVFPILRVLLIGTISFFVFCITMSILQLDENDTLLINSLQ
ncbi:flippase [Halorarum halobium]|uniref:flippase n=1 Tax=Halorarum halobium TaxID=3075121 RepID=UPI0028B1AD32|nr:flippase [Halobaculum sp. XH14]